MMRALFIGTSQFGQDGASKWSSFRKIMGKVPPSFYVGHDASDFACDKSQSRFIFLRRNVAGHTGATTVRFRATIRFRTTAS
jgi:hypothetical protein